MCKNCPQGPFFDHSIAAFRGYEQALQPEIEFAQSFGWRVEDLGDGILRYSNGIFGGYASPITIHDRLVEMKEAQERNARKRNS